MCDDGNDGLDGVGPITPEFNRVADEPVPKEVHERDYRQELDRTNPHLTLDYTPGGQLEQDVHREVREEIEEGFAEQQRRELQRLKEEWDIQKDAGGEPEKGGRDKGADRDKS
ncbi:hypothetical protein [Oceanicaulis alexandrii]|uniref:hypothetical protein n=1 Tax=Oceanicaulis alexandrii TaxID=153233 RepID=UPI0003B6764D|nr:hypothetical protein [Oceanicaulis alexandrii]